MGSVATITHNAFNNFIALGHQQKTKRAFSYYSPKIIDRFSRNAWRKPDLPKLVRYPPCANPLHLCSSTRIYLRSKTSHLKWYPLLCARRKSCRSNWRHCAYATCYLLITWKAIANFERTWKHNNKPIKFTQDFPPEAASNIQFPDAIVHNNNIKFSRKMHPQTTLSVNKQPLKNKPQPFSGTCSLHYRPDLRGSPTLILIHELALWNRRCYRISAPWRATAWRENKDVKWE